MAFNPFDVFRRNQRILFAALTVVVMFMFVLSFGQGDFFSMVPQWLAARQRTGDVLAVVDGAKVYSSEVGDIDARRLMANQYMAAAAFQAAAGLRDVATQTLPRVTAANKQVIEEAIRLQANGFTSPNMMTFRQMALQGGLPPAMGKMLIDDAERNTVQTQQRLAGILAGQNTPAPDQEAAQAIIRGIELQQRQLAAAPTRREAQHYFSNQPAATNRDSVEFLLWLKKADQLGIAFTDADVLTLANAEFYNVMKDDDWLAAEREIRGRTRYSPALLRSALADEFRVRAAQAAVLGLAYVRPNAPAFDAPVDYYEFFHDQTAAATFGTVGIPAAAFVSQVTGTPDPAALRKLYQEGQLEDPVPGTARIGLREPRRLKVEWVEITGDEPFYTAAAAEAATALAAATKLGGFLAVAPVVGGTPALLLAAASPAVAADPQLDQAYASYVARQREIIQSNWYTPFGGATQVPDTSFAKTPAAAGLVATMALPGTPLAGPALMAGAAVAADRKARLNTVPPVLFAPILPGAANLALAIGMVAPQAAAVQTPPRAAVQSQLVADYRKSLTRTIAQRDADRLTKELAALNAKPDDPAARKLIDDFVKARGLKTGASKEFRDQYTIAADPGLRPVAEKFETQYAGQSPTAAALAGFIGQQFFTEADPTSQRRGPATGFYKPQVLPAQGPAVAVLAWRTAEQPGERLRDFNAPDVRAKLEAAWRRVEARKLAKKAAEELAAKCGNLGQTVVEIEPKVREAQAQLAARLPESERGQVTYFKIDNVAPITRQVLPASDVRSRIGSFQVTPTDNIPYPTPQMTTDLLAAKDKPPSTTVVMTDAPGDTAYTAVLLYRTDPDVTTFASLVFGSQAAMSELAPVVRRAHQDDLRKQARQRGVALLQAEFGYDKESAKLDSRGGDE